MRTFDFCLPTKANIVPDGPDWLHEVKYDCYRLRVERDGDRVRVRLITRGGYDRTKRFPWIVEAALKNRQKRFVLDGEGRPTAAEQSQQTQAAPSGQSQKMTAGTPERTQPAPSEQSEKMTAGAAQPRPQERRLMKAASR